MASCPKTESFFLSVLQQMLAILSTPFLLSIIFDFIHLLGFPHHVTSVLVIQISNHILGEDVCLVVSSVHKHNLDETIFNELPDKVIAHIHMLGSGACAHIFCHEDYPNIVHLNDHGQLHLNADGK